MTPPKDKTFLADIGYPYYVYANYNKAMDYFVYAELQVDMYLVKYEDTYFITESFHEEELKGWVEVPEVKR